MVDLVNPLALSDEDFAKFNSPEEVNPVVETPAATEVVEDPSSLVPEKAAEAAVTEPVVEPVVEEPAKTTEEAKPEEKAVDLPDDEFVKAGPPAVVDPAAKPEVKADDATKVAEPGAAATETKKPEGEVDPTAKPEAVAEAAPLNYAEIGELIMKPFKANGKMITLKDPEEAIKLMQMGAHFTRKMQAIQPHRKVLAMLENNELLDEDRLSYLIDLDKKNPEAIKKLIKDSGIDPLEIDTSVEPSYREGSHKVTDAEVNFSSMVEDLVSTDEGKESLQVFNTTWDQASKEQVWAEPGLLQVMHTQRENGIYDRISAEIDRQRMLGTITPETSFINAYQTVGTELHNAGAFNDLVTAKTATTAEVKPAVVTPPVVEAPVPVAVATTEAAPKQAVDNNDKASAASPTRSTTTPAKPFINPLAMSDDDFLKEFKGRF